MPDAPAAHGEDNAATGVHTADSGGLPGRAGGYSLKALWPVESPDRSRVFL